MSQETIYLIELTDSTGTVFRFCSGTGYTSLPTDTPPNAFYSPRVEQPGLFRQNMYASGTTSGRSSGGYGEIVLINTDGGLDSFVDLGFDGQLCVVKQGNPGAALSTFATIITGTVEQPEVSWSRVTTRLKDKTALLETPSQTLLYLGNNALPDGIEGTSELKDKPKPRLLGVCNNVTPILVNSSKLIYQAHSGKLRNIGNVFDSGVALVSGSNHIDSAALQAATPAPASYDTCLDEGLFRLGSSPFGLVTCDAMQGEFDSDCTAGQIINLLALEKLTANSVVSQSIIDLDKSAPYIVGLYTGGAEMTTAACLDILCASVGAWWGFDNLGNLWAKQLTAPVAAQALTTIMAEQIISIDRTATADGDKGVPVWRVNVDFFKNWTVQSSGLAGSLPTNTLTFEPDAVTPVDLPRRQELAMEYFRTKAEDAAVKTTHLLAPEITIKTTINALADAEIEAARVLALRKVRRDRLTVKVPTQAIQYPSGGYWDDEAINELPAPLNYGTIKINGNYAYHVGGTSGPTKVATIYRLDLNSRIARWDALAVTPLPIARQLPCVTFYNNFMYVFGGFTTIPGNALKAIRLDMSNPLGAWDDAGVTDLPANPFGRSGAMYQCAQYGSYVYVVGSASGYTDGFALRLDLNNPTGAWDDAGVSDVPSYSGRVYMRLEIYNNYLYQLAGQDYMGYQKTEVIRLNLDNPTGGWITTGVTNLPFPSSLPMTAILGSYIYYSGSTVHARVSRLNLNNPAGIWEEMSELPIVRMNTSGFAYNGNVYSVGGVNTDYLDTSNTFILRQNNNPSDLSQLTSLGRTLLIKHPRYGYAAGRPMKIIGTESDHKNRMMTLELWG